MVSGEQFRDEYVRRVNLVTDFIESHLDRSMKLEELADVAHFSRFHFHRIFASIVGETLNQFIARLRVERAASLLVHRPELSITTIAFNCGFSGSATFARRFREAFQMSATQWREQGLLRQSDAKSKICKPIGKLGKAESLVSLYLDVHNPIPTWRLEMKIKQENLTATVQVQTLNEHNVAYVRSVGPYGRVQVVRQMFEALLAWAGPRGHLRAQTRFFSVAHDNPG